MACLAPLAGCGGGAPDANDSIAPSSAADSQAGEVATTLEGSASESSASPAGAVSGQTAAGIDKLQGDGRFARREKSGTLK
jgi:hypothetical protein